MEGGIDETTKAEAAILMQPVAAVDLYVQQRLSRKNLTMLESLKLQRQAAAGIGRGGGKRRNRNRWPAAAGWGGGGRKDVSVWADDKAT